MEAGPVQPQGLHQAQGLDHRLREPERRHRAGMRLLRPRPDRQGHVGDAGPDGGDAGGEDRASEGRRQLRLGAEPDRGDAARAALPQGRRLRGAGGARQGRAARLRRGAARDPDRQLPQVDARADPPRGREQRAGHPRLRRALDRPGRRLLQGARHQRRRPDGGPRHLPHLGAAHRQLAAPRRGRARTR